MKKFLMVVACAAMVSAQLFGRTPSRRRPYRSLYRPTTLDLRAPAIYRARFRTTKGEFVIEVHREWAPLGADRFYNLVKFGFYNGGRFFRISPGFVVQFGLNPFGRINLIWSHYPIQDDPVRKSNTLGTVSFAATAKPNSRTTQVFINLRDNSKRLDTRGFAAFGEVTSGMNVVESLYSGYGDVPPFGTGPDSAKAEVEGEPYFAKYYPRLDKIISATIVPIATAQPRAK